ncbi:extracellular solute-binding protein [Companilactobacillus hulinensis]|uniref:extracellular solute-binding protein n=1 Tax=Companilactobacillus hulinensis TaxID=2486007 RepID=UPI000F79DB77|nr:extracellular solute-binding protein [Companilactobacillus hulinensis]
MSNATISDIAKKAQVSIGTVSNVLNKKGNVRIETIRKVEETAKQLNYVRNTNALSIRQKDSTIIALVMPRLNEQTSALYSNVYHELILKNLTLKLYETNSNVQEERECYRQINQQNCRGIFVINPIASIKDLKSWIDDPSNLIVLAPQSQTLKIDLSQITKKIDGRKTVVVKDELSFGFYKYFENLKCISNNMRTIYQELESVNNEFIIVFNDKLANRIETMLETSHNTTTKIILLTSRNIVSFQDNQNKTIFHYSANKIALEFVKLLGQEESNTINIYQIDYELFPTQDSKSELNLLMLETPFSKILSGLLADFTNKYQVKINIFTKDFDTMREILADNNLEKYDLIRLDISDFNWYGRQIFQPLDQFTELDPIISKMSNWKKYIYINKIPYSIPLDPSVQMMLYQKGIFNNAILQKQFAEKFGKELLPPSTYQELINFAEFMDELDLPEKDNYYPISLIDSTSTLIASEFLPYYYSLGGKIKYNTGIFSFNSDVFIKTYNMYQSLRTQSKIESKSWWDSETDAFNNRQTALVVGFTNHLNNIDQVSYGIAPIPGNIPALGGGVIGINKNSTHTDAAILFLQWLYQYQIQHEIALMGGDVPATDLFFEREIYEQFPFLSSSIDLYNTGIRKTKVSSDNPINTLLFEKLLGEQIHNGIVSNLDATSVLVNINNSLIQNSTNLVRVN